MVRATSGNGWAATLAEIKPASRAASNAGQYLRNVPGGLFRARLGRVRIIAASLFAVGPA
ncbi:hypothetical protein V6C53_02460, partial [Desulfocurvibacter africanus]|uniref:hypothetical protein n=1 Tax=Desulfocurvibacter africanus TaxID=873 RepID=UPI002FD94ED1